MASLLQIREAIKQTIRAKFDGITVYNYIPEQMETPCAVITLDPEKKSGWPQSFARGTATYYVQIMVVVDRSESDMDQIDLDAYIDLGTPDSIPNLLFENSTLGLPATDSWFEGMTGYSGEFADSGDPQTGAILCLRVTTDPSGG